MQCTDIFASLLNYNIETRGDGMVSGWPLYRSSSPIENTHGQNNAGHAGLGPCTGCGPDTCCFRPTSIEKSPVKKSINKSPVRKYLRLCSRRRNELAECHCHWYCDLVWKQLSDYYVPLVVAVQLFH